MKSYIIIDRIEGKFAVCELEFISVEQSREVDYWERDTEMIDVPTSMLEDPNEGDVFVVEHEEKRFTGFMAKIMRKSREELRH